MIKSVVISTVHTSAPWKAVAKRIDSRLQGYLTTRFAYKNHQVSSVQLITEYSSPALTWVTLHRSSAKQGVSHVKTSGAAHQLTSIQCIGDASVEQGSVVTKRIALKYVAWENSDSEKLYRKRFTISSTLTSSSGISRQPEGSRLSSGLPLPKAPVICYLGSRQAGMKSVVASSLHVKLRHLTQNHSGSNPRGSPSPTLGSAQHHPNPNPTAEFLELQPIGAVPLPRGSLQPCISQIIQAPRTSVSEHKAAPEIRPSLLISDLWEKALWQRNSTAPPTAPTLQASPTLPKSCTTSLPHRSWENTLRNWKQKQSILKIFSN